MPTVPHDLFRRFFENTDKPSDPAMCWRWTGYLDLDGYGLLWVKIGRENPRNHRAPRLSYLIHTGDIPEGMWVCHRCDNPVCVNPAHLFLGTPQDNSWDMTNKGRTQALRGEKNPHAKLTSSDVAEIRVLIEQGVSLTEIARRFSVTQSNISNIKNGVTWVESKKTMGRPASITRADAAIIRVERAKGVSTAELQRRFNVSRSVINRTVNGKLFPEK